ncbi:MAG: hypothetical protein K8I27_07310 [Planctomycetes bacterium]|nr:hypothetical protein [Planctomycetota bacterium]
MNNAAGRKTNTGVVLLSLFGLMACLVLGAWFMLQDDGTKPAQKPVSPAAEMSR